MRHRKAGRKLNRNATHRLALFRNLSRALITHERITTTVPKAKELRPYIERLITLAKKAAIAKDGTDAGKVKSLHYLRQAMARLGPVHGTGVYDKKNELVEVNDTVLKKLINDIGPRYKDRPGGYTRILKLHTRRLGDAGEQAIIELLKAGETKPKKERPVAPSLAPAPEGAAAP
jgi:large subunit ribosomal protein L17